jgi:hypothetical protein
MSFLFSSPSEEFWISDDYSEVAAYMLRLKRKAALEKVVPAEFWNSLDNYTEVAAYILCLTRNATLAKVVEKERISGYVLTILSDKDMEQLGISH